MNLPNKLSLFRVVLVPIIAILYLFCDLGMAFQVNVQDAMVTVQWSDIVVLILFAIASFTDFLDGNIWRDTIVDGLRMSASAKGKVVAAGMPGKIKTVLQMFAIIFVMLYDLPFAYLGIPMDQIFIWGATIASVYSGIVYFMKLKDVVMETM